MDGHLLWIEELCDQRQVDEIADDLRKQSKYDIQLFYCHRIESHNSSRHYRTKRNVVMFGSEMEF